MNKKQSKTKGKLEKILNEYCVANGYRKLGSVIREVEPQNFHKVFNLYLEDDDYIKEFKRYLPEIN